MAEHMEETRVPAAGSDADADSDVNASADAPESAAPGAPGASDASAAPVNSDANGRSRRRAVVAGLLGAGTVVLGSLGIWAIVAAHSLNAAAGAANSALIDRSATRKVETDVTRAVNTIFSYTYADTARTKAAAQRLLAGQAIRQYDRLFGLVQQQAPAQKLVVTTKVTRIGVELLTAGRARVLVFANQQDTRAGTAQASYGGAMFAVTAVQEKGIWKIENIDTFTGSS
jgi:Mce-associated membrane protein